MNVPFKQKLSQEKIALGAILVLAAFWRFFRIDQLPPGLRFDEAFNLSDILTLVQGSFTIFFPANNGREPFFNYLAIVATMVFGAQPIALRITAAIIGTVTVFLMYGFARALFRSTRIGLLAAFCLAISVWHTYYSRYGLRVILALALTTLTLWFFWRALSPSPALRGRVGVGVRYYALAGVFAAMTAYTYLSGRLTPFLLIALTIAAIVADRKNWRTYLQGLCITGIIAFILFIPLGAYFITHPEDFFAHGTSLSIWDPNVNKGDLVGTFFSNIGQVAGMFFVRGDFEAFRNVPDRPAFDPLLGGLFLVGCVLLVRDLFSPRSSQEHRLRAFLITAAMIMFLSSSILSDDPPNFTRTLPTLSVLMILPAWGASAIWDRLRGVSARSLAAGAFGIVALACTTWSFNDYFLRFATSPSLYYAFDVRMFDVAEWINQNARTNTIYLAPLWYQQGTLSLLTRQTPLKSFESRDTIILPSRTSGNDALYAFPPEQEKKGEKLAERLGSLAKRESVTGSTGEQILVVYRVPSANLPNSDSPISNLLPTSNFTQSPKSVRAQWGDALELLGYSVDALDTPKRNLEVTLFFHALKPASQDYTFSIKARDAQDRVWGQEDKWLGDNSYATTQMGAGDLIIEKFYPGLNACAPEGDYRITVEAYNPQTAQTWELSGGGRLVSLNTTRAEASQGNRYEDLEPEQTIDALPAPNARLFGFTAPHPARAGDTFSLSLFWRGLGDGNQTSPVTIRLRDASKRDFVLSEKTVTLPVDGRGLCVLLDLQTPKESANGTSALFVNETKITDITISQSSKEHQ